jgi:GntR family transcriptional regulator
LYDLLTERYGLRVARAREALEPVRLRAREARLLGRRPGSLALLIEGVASTADGVPVEFGRTFVRGDRSRYYVERVVLRPTRREGAKEESRVAGRGDGRVRT